MIYNQPCVTVLIAPLPIFLSQSWPPKKLGELAFLAKNYTIEWSNMLAALQSNYSAGEDFCKELSTLSVQQIPDPQLRQAVEGFLLFRAPTYARTLFCISEFLDILAKDRDLARKHHRMVGLTGSYILSHLVCPKSNDRTVRKYIEKLYSKGITFYEYQAETSPFGEIKGEYLWVMPAGSGFIPFSSATSLAIVFSQALQNPVVDAFFDGSYSCVLRVSSLRKLTSVPTVTDVPVLISLLQKEGLQIVTNKDDMFSLCDIESIYGGSSPFPRSKAKSFWSRLFGR